MADLRLESDRDQTVVGHLEEFSARVSIVLVALAAACLLSAATAEEELGELGEGSCVSSLDTGNFEAAIRGKNALIVFFAPWCGHCEQFAKFYHEVGAHFSADPKVNIARLDVDEHRAAAESYGVTGLPSLQLFPRGYKRRGLHFRGSERTPARIISFVKSPQVYLVEATVTDMPEWDCVLWLESRGLLARGEISGRFGLTPEHLRAFESVARDGTKGEASGDDDRGA